MMHVLVVEDEKELSSTLCISLKRMGLRPVATASAQGALNFFEGDEEQPDIVLLDRNLPDGDGLNLCRRLRDQYLYAGKILMLTAMGETVEKVKGLNAGADDYLSKPFSWDELEARINALGRRSAKAGAARRWKLDPDRLRIKGPDGWITLTPLEYKLAHTLISRSGSIVSRERLLREVWGFHLIPKTRTVDQFMGRLRRHFEKDPEKPKYFLTVRGAGYRFNPDGTRD